MKERDSIASKLGPARRSASSPLWSQVKAALVKMIRDEGLAEHSRLPSEAELCARFGVSRTVVREAMSQLVNEQMIYRWQGKGAFVAGSRDDQDFVGTTVGFSGELTDKHKQVTRQILRQEVAPPTARIAKMMRLDETTPLVFIDRVQSVEGVPRMVVRWAMPESIVPGLQDLPMQTRSLYETISRQYGVQMVKAERWIEAIAANEIDAGLLDVAPGTPLLAIESIAQRFDGRIVEYYTAHYLTDRSRLHFLINSAI